MPAPESHISVGTSPSSDSWGFVGTVSVGPREAFRTMRSYDSPSEALAAAQLLLADVLGASLAAEEWRSSREEFGHPPRRSDFGYGLPNSAPPNSRPAPNG